MKLKQGLLYMILDNPNSPNKYSKAFLNLKNVFELEKKENFKFSPEICEKFTKIEEKYLSFINNIPLKVIETYFTIYSNDLEHYIYLDYQGSEVSDLKIIDLFIKLEQYYEEIFALACEIANFYNLEIKLKGQKGSSLEMI
ncbi:MAG: hypothetical protein ACOC5T_05025 [Elusimicrobiota bacterium]